MNQSRKINILFVHQSADMYGSDKMLLALATGLDPEKFNPMVILPCEGPLYTALKKKLDSVYIVPLLLVGRSLLSFSYLLSLPNSIYKTTRALDKLLAGQPVDLVHTNTLAVWTGAFWARRHKIRHIWNVREMIVKPKWVGKLTAHLLERYSTRVIGNSPQTIDLLVQYNRHLKKKVSYIYNGVAPQVYSQGTTNFREELGIPHQSIVITLVGRINRMKGQKLLIQAGEMLSRRLPGHSLVYLIVGSTPHNQAHFHDELTAFVDNSVLKKSVRIIDYVDEISDIWKMTDICVVPSTEPESFGLVAVEAMQQHKAVVAADHGGLQDIVVQDVTGLKFEPGDAAALTDALETLILDEQLRVSLGQAGYARYQENFTQEKCIAGFENEYIKLMEK